MQSLSDLAGGGRPLPLRELQSEFDERLRKVPNRLNEYGYDPFGLRPTAVRRAMVLGALLYRHYFRVETHGIENAARRPRAGDREPRRPGADRRRR